MSMCHSTKRAACLVTFGILGLALASSGARPAAAQPDPKPPAPQEKKEPKFDRVGCNIVEIDAAKNKLKVKLDDGGNETTIDLDAKTKAVQEKRHTIGTQANSEAKKSEPKNPRKLFN